MATQPSKPWRKIDELIKKVRAFYIINDAGLLEHYEYFVETDEDPDLHSAMFATVHMYSKQLGGGDIELISLENHKFAFSNYEGKLVVLNVDVDMSSEESLWLIEQIMDRFETIEQLRQKNPEGRLLFKSLFEELGRSIEWETIKSIREGAFLEQLKNQDIVETSNMTKINVKSKIWIKIRQIISKIVKTHTQLRAGMFIVKNKGHINYMYSGRDPPEDYDDIATKAMEELQDPFANIDQEPRMVPISKGNASIFPAFCFEGAFLILISDDLYELERLSSQTQRVVAAIEKLTMA